MPEELNRVARRPASRRCSCARREPAVPTWRAEGITRGVHVVGDVMVDVARLVGAGAAARLALPGAARARARRLPARDRAPRVEHRAALARPSGGRPQRRSTSPSCVPLHPRTRGGARARRASRPRCGRAMRVIPPLGYVDFTALLRAARLCLTDSGGVQKEAYLHGVPCVTLRDTSEWVETVRLGLERARRRRPGGDSCAPCASSRRPRERPPLYGDGHAVGAHRGAAGGRRLALPVACVAHGTPHRHHRRGLRRPAARRRVRGRRTARRLHRDGVGRRSSASTTGDSYIADVPSERLRALVDAGPAARDDEPGGGHGGATTSSSACRRRSRRTASPTSRTSRGAADGIAPHLQRGPARRARVDDLPGHDARGAEADPRARLGPRGGRGLPPRDVARAHRPGPHRLHHPHDAEGRRRAHRRLHRARLRALRAGRRHARARSRRPRRPSSRSCSRTSSARSTSRS